MLNTMLKEIYEKKKKLVDHEEASTEEDFIQSFIKRKNRGKIFLIPTYQEMSYSKNKKTLDSLFEKSTFLM